MSVYRCKNCGQLVEPERNKTCPACKAELAGNMVKVASTDEIKKAAKVKKTVAVILASLVALVLLGFVFCYWLPKLNDQKAKQRENEFAANTSSSETVSDKASLQSNSGKLAYKENTYFIYSNNINFSESINKAINDGVFGSADKNKLLTFVAVEYETGDVWLREGDPYCHVFFAPAEKFMIDDLQYRLLVPIYDIGGISASLLPNSQATLNNEFYALSGSQYYTKVFEMYELLKERLLGGEEIEALIIDKKDDKELSLQNITVRFEFDEYSVIQTAEGLVYETANGTRYSHYIEIPHRLYLNPIELTGKTTLNSEVKIEQP